MGLAASQARFLAITARKMNCEFQSMQVAQDKLSVTRDMQKAAQNYQTALDATKLVWDVDDDVYDLTYGVMMTPSLLNDFNPYLITDTRGKIVLTNNMFNAAVAAGIVNEDTGEPRVSPFMGEVGSTDDGSRNAFLYQLGLVNQISGSVVDGILALGPDGYTKSGIGGPIFDKSRANALTTPLFINYLRNTTYADAGIDTPKVISLKKGAKMNFDAIYSQSEKWCYKKDETLNEDMSFMQISYKAGDYIDRDMIVKIPAGVTVTVPDGKTYYTINDPKSDYDTNPEGLSNCTAHGGPTTITSGNILLKRGTAAPFDFDIYVQTNEVNHKATDKLFAVNLVDIFKDSDGKSLLFDNRKKFEKDAGIGKFYVTQNGQCISNPDTLAQLTLGDILMGKYEIAYHPSNTNYMSETRGIFLSIVDQIAKILGQGSHDNKGLNVDADSDLALDQALAMTRMLFTNPQNTGVHYASSLNDDASKTNQAVKGKNNIYSFSLTNTLKSFLTYFAIALEGQESGYQVSKTSVKDSDYVTDDMSYYFIVDKNNVMEDQDMLNADFYNMLYNQIATHGACTDAMKREQVTDKEYLQQAIKNGQLFISALSSDGHFYQRPYSLLDPHVAEVADEDAIARAEVEYNVTKSKLNAKEETLELKMKNLDMEISSLTTEFDTVKNLISKNVEKVFTMFSS